MKLKLNLDVDLCCACSACAIACMDQNDIDIKKMKPFRYIREFEENQQFTYFSVSCLHCDDAPCIKACPTGCLRKDNKTQLTVYDNTNCIGCHSCLLVCPVGAPSFNQEGKMQKCDGCLVRIQNGRKPACTMVCPSKALTLVDDDENDAGMADDD